VPPLFRRSEDDKSLYNHAVRIRARAIRRCGELLREFEPAKNHHDRDNRTQAAAGLSRSVAASAAGLSPRQAKDALRVANVEQEDFDEAVDSDEPPTVTALAEAGKASRPPSTSTSTASGNRGVVRGPPLDRGPRVVEPIGRAPSMPR
jgi:hypothetical protein